MKKIAFLLLLPLMWLAGCSSDDKAETTVAVTGVTIDQPTLTLTVGQSKTLVATVAPEDATTKDVVWTTSKAEVASVGEKTGVVTAVAAGTATITVTTVEGAKTATCTVTVVEPEPEKVVASFEGKLSAANSQFMAVDKVPEQSVQYDATFTDNDNLLTFTHTYADWGTGYTFSRFTFTNMTDNSAANSIAAITQAAKEGTIYLSVNSSDFTPASFTVNDPAAYSLNGAWVTNCTYAYNGMTVGDSYSTAFKAGSWFKLTAKGYDAEEQEIGSVDIYLANYQSDDDKPANEWIWFDMTPIADAIKVVFSLESTDTGKWGMNTPAYFCMDGVTLQKR